jgi:hypothetical protein
VLLALALALVNLAPIHLQHNLLPMKIHRVKILVKTIPDLRPLVVVVVVVQRPAVINDIAADE